MLTKSAAYRISNYIITIRMESCLYITHLKVLEVLLG